MRRASASILTHKKVIYSSSGSLPIVRMAYDTEALILFIATVLPLGVWLATNGDLSGGSFLHFLQTHDSRWTAARVRDALDPPHPRRAARARQDEVKSTTQATASTLRAPPYRRRSFNWAWLTRVLPLERRRALLLLRSSLAPLVRLALLVSCPLPGLATKMELLGIKASI